jgi:hypothetical protein
MSWCVEVAHLCQLARLRLLQPESHVHLAVHGRGNGQVLTSLLQPVGTLIQLAKSELGNEGPHAARLGKGERLAEVAFALRAGLW